MDDCKRAASIGGVGNNRSFEQPVPLKHGSAQRKSGVRVARPYEDVNCIPNLIAIDHMIRVQVALLIAEGCRDVIFDIRAGQRRVRGEMKNHDIRMCHAAIVPGAGDGGTIGSASWAFGRTKTDLENNSAFDMMNRDDNLMPHDGDA
jgi:hypothetical protein